MLRAFIFLFLIALFGTGGDVSLSHAMKQIGEVTRFTPRALLSVAWRAVRVPWLWLGILLLTCAFFSFLSLLSWQPVSFVLPASALGFVVGAFAARFILGEKVDPTRWAGVITVCLGMVVLWMGQDDLPVNRREIVSIFRYILMALAIAPLAYQLMATIAARRFFASQPGNHRGTPDFAPPVSILKPLYGLDREAYENYASFCRVDYPEYEILFAVDRNTDPAVPIVEKLIADFPGRQIKLLIGAQNIGTNNKVCKLARMAAEAKYGYFVISDSDVRVEPDYLRTVMSPFRDPNVGVVTSLYRGMTDEQLGTKMDCLGASVEFSAGVLMARQLEGLKFAMGSTMACSRERLAEIGGFEALADMHSDDYEFGRRIAENGYRVELTAAPVWMIFPSMTLAQYLRHEMRWQIGIRHVRPWSHASLLFTHALPLTLIAAAVSPARWIAAAYLFAYLILRLTAGWTIGVAGLNDPAVRRNLWLLPLRDLLAFAAWCASFISDTIHWSGLKFTLEEGRMVPVVPPTDRA
jgi:ceramide glucosyltransferase